MFMDKLADLVRTPKGRRLLREAKRLTHDPGRRAEIDEAGRRIAAQGARSSRGRSGPGHDRDH
jgi:hypothetical protein